MKKLITILLAMVLSIACLFSFGCAEKQKTVGDSGKIIVGITDYAPMDYLDDDGNWTGFDAELSKVVFGNLGYTVEFKEIDWDTKIVTLNAGTIDCIWNGMTVTDELLDNLLLTTPYLKNAQVAVVKVENLLNYTSKNDLIGKKVAVESGSAAVALVSAIQGVSKINKATNQNAAVLDVFGNQSDVAIVDNLLARTLCLSSDYFGKLAYVDIGFSADNAEEFAVALRKSDSKLFYKVNKEIEKLKKDGTILALALKYGIADSVI